MDETVLLLKALFVGVLVAAPMGPVNVLCIHRTLTRGRLDGFLTGLGGAFGDAAFAVIAAFGLSAAATFIRDNEIWFRVPGGAFLLAMGIVIWMRHPHIEGGEDDAGGVVRSFFSSFLLTVTNPITLAAFAGFFVALDLVTGVHYVAASAVVLGVFSGSALWWLGIVTITGLLHGKVEDRHLEVLNRIVAIAVILFGVYAIDSVTLKLL